MKIVLTKDEIVQAILQYIRLHKDMGWSFIQKEDVTLDAIINNHDGPEFDINYLKAEVEVNSK